MISALGDFFEAMAKLAGLVALAIFIAALFKTVGPEASGVPDDVYRVINAELKEEGLSSVAIRIASLEERRQVCRFNHNSYHFMAKDTKNQVVSGILCLRGGEVYMFRTTEVGGKE